MSHFAFFLRDASAEAIVGFDPVLNLPALSSFLVITAVFVALQVRILAIREAAELRTRALRALQDAKANELEGTVSREQLEHALSAYRRAYNDVERLRSIAPGVRIAAAPPPPPGFPSTGGGRTSIEDANAEGARRFLGLTGVADRESRADTNAPGEGDITNSRRGLPIPLSALLVTVAASLLMLLGLLSVDPMESSFGAVTAVDDWSGLE